MDLDLRRLRYFVEVADLESFVHAATRLHITQPALSRQIASLENDLGVQLFERSRRGTRITESGSMLLERARALLGSAQTFERDARLLGRSPARFVVGFMPGVEAGAIVDEFKQRFPDVELSTIFTSISAQARFLTDGRADVVFCRPPFAVDVPVRTIDLFDEAMVAAVGSDDPLADNDVLTLDDLAQRGLPVVQRGTSGYSESDEFDPPTAIASVSAGVAVAILPAGIAAFYSEPGVVYRPLSDVPDQKVALAYRLDRAMPHTVAFAAICRQALETTIRDLPRLLVSRETPLSRVS